MTTVKIIELIGTSPNGWQDAVQVAVKEASETIRKIHGIDVLNQTAKVENDEIVEYRVNLKLSFKVEEDRKSGRTEGTIA
jgi:flavin-binding protein dodecin